VADFSTHFSGPVAARQMVQLGADVIKIEHPRLGDGNRGVTPIADGEGVLHPYINAGTRSLTVDARSDAWPRVVEAVCKWADVVIVGTRPSAARARGIDYASAVGHNPEIIYCLISGYGIDGPWADFPAHGLNMDVLAGAMPLEWVDGRPLPYEDYRSVGTTLAGVEAAVGIYAALYRRSQGAGSQFVNVSIWESALSWQWRDLTTFKRMGIPWHGYRHQGSRYWTYRTADDKAILVCPIERHFWERFCNVVGLPDEMRANGDWELTGMDFGDGNEDERDLIQQYMAKRTRDEWQELLIAADIPCAAILTPWEAMDSEHAEANGAMVSFSYNGRETTIPTTPVSITPRPDGELSEAVLAAAHRDKGKMLTPPPQLGEHNAEILTELGLTDLISG
jgi:crotonobetainyl-CoA:carnitine CoA-transferase CaiB-like acyl-CoA transferase